MYFLKRVVELGLFLKPPYIKSHNIYSSVYFKEYTSDNICIRYLYKITRAIDLNQNLRWPSIYGRQKYGLDSSLPSLP